MAKVSVELDQQISSDVGEGHGIISIRVVVLTPRPPGEPGKAVPSDADDEPDEDPDDTSGGPLASYLEKKTYGKYCAVFLVNGQRHHAWDNTFISRDLGFKFLRDRTMVIVDLDGLADWALSEIVTGSRQGLYEGKVFLAIKDKIIQTLKSNPELKRLQREAEQKALDMKAGDAAVRSQLDQLIEGHHAAAQASGPHGPDAGGATAGGGRFGEGTSDQAVVLMSSADGGEAGSLPVLVATPAASHVRLHPGQSREVRIAAVPSEAWATREEFRAEVVTEDENLTSTLTEGSSGAAVTISFAATDYDDDDFPVLGELQVFARFKGHTEPRVVRRPIVVTKKPDPPDPIKLLDDPTFLRVRSRQPVRLIAGGAAVHVRMQWNGLPSLLRGNRPRWRFSARCLTLGTFPRIGFGYMPDGRLTFILYPPSGLLTGITLDFEVVADGPHGRQLRATFRGVISDPPEQDETDQEPRRVTDHAPPPVGQRRPPYVLKYITQSEWADPERTCFQGGGEWTENDAGCFLETSGTPPLLLLVINEDMKLLKEYREGMIRRKPPLDPETIKRRTNRYISHVAFHLYQMYNEKAQQEREPTSVDNGSPAPRTVSDMRAEINRVGTTLMKMMEVG
jgi:hypothetical protein